MFPSMSFSTDIIVGAISGFTLAVCVLWDKRCRRIEQERQIRNALAETREKIAENERRRRREQAEVERRNRALKLADVDNMEGLDFEQYVGRLLVDRGFTVHVTSASNDLGVDIVAERDGQRYAVQVKRHSSVVSRRAVSDAVAGKQHYGFQHAMVVTNSYFTRGAVELAHSTGCELIDRHRLAEWILLYQQEAEGEPLTAEGEPPASDDLEFAWMGEHFLSEH
jgi:hypothetical protein